MKNSAPMPRRPLCQFISAVHAACIMSSETQKARPTGKSTEGMLESEAKFSFAMLPLLEPRVRETLVCTEKTAKRHKWGEKQKARPKGVHAQ